MSQLFLIAIGGTGMRCLESFVNLCAIGMMDQMEVNVLAIDTDFNNGNLERTKNHLDNYLRIKRKGSSAIQSDLKDSFFSAKLNFYYFSPEYTGEKQNFRTLSKINRLGEKASKQNKLLADLLFDDKVQKFNLSHGYRAQTHLGSHLMYHAILDEFREVNAGKPEEAWGLSKFIEKLSNGGEDPKVFILGSIFGGTGASSIPILPKALRDAKKQIDPSAEMPMGIIYGSTLLTSYFKFSKPKSDQVSKEHLIADSDRFGLNCQAALKFYNEDTTIRNAYKRFYHIGWPTMAYDYDDQSLKEQQKRTSDKVLTGGGEQKNPCHVIEMLCAFAAYHFFKDNKLRPTSQLTHMYKSVDFDSDTNRPSFDFEDFVGNDRVEIDRFKSKLSAFVAFSMMIQNDFDGHLEDFIKGLARGNKAIADQYRDIDTNDYKAIDQFITHFSYEFINDGVMSNWLHQLQQSSESSNFLGFNKDVYLTDSRGLQRANWGKVWAESERHFPKGRRSLSFSAKAYERFLTPFKLGKEIHVDPDPEIDKPLERLLNHIYKTMNTLHNFKK